MNPDEGELRPQLLDRFGLLGQRAVVEPRRADHLLSHAGDVHRAANEDDAINAGEQLLAAGYLMGLMSETTAQYFRGGDVDEARIEAMIAQRNVARAGRDFATADRIRDELADMGIELEDTSEGTRWSINR